MDRAMEQPARDGSGRFAPGCSGNPKGKAPGTRNRATVLRALMRDGDEDAIGRVLIDRALGGDPVAARFLIDGLNPKPRQRTITLDLPDGADATAIFTAAKRAMVVGQISPQEASSVVHFIEDGQRMVQAAADIQRANAAHRAVAAVRAALTASAIAKAADPLQSTCKSTSGAAVGHPLSQPSPGLGVGAGRPSQPQDSGEGVPVERSEPPRSEPPLSAQSIAAAVAPAVAPPTAMPPREPVTTRRRAAARARAASPLHSACKSTITEAPPPRSNAATRPHRSIRRDDGRPARP
jgi:hypothetical protein